MDVIPCDPTQAGSAQTLPGPEPVIDPIFLQEYRSPRFPDRKNFVCCDDIAILRTVNQTKPWEAGHGKTMTAWTSMAEMLSQDTAFIKGEKGPAIKVRFETLMKTFEADEMASMRKSGAVELFTEREQLLQDISCRIDDFTGLQKANKKENCAKQAAIEKSGDIVRRLAIDGPETDPDLSSGEGSSDDDDSDGVKKSRRSRKKRRKITKRDKLDQLMSTIQGAITESSQLEKTRSPTIPSVSSSTVWSRIAVLHTMRRRMHFSCKWEI